MVRSSKVAAAGGHSSHISATRQADEAPYVLDLSPSPSELKSLDLHFPAQISPQVSFRTLGNLLGCARLVELGML